MDHREWARARQNSQYAQYFAHAAWAGLSAAPTASSIYRLRTDPDRVPIHPILSNAREFSPEPYHPQPFVFLEGDRTIVEEDYDEQSIPLSPVSTATRLSATTAYCFRDQDSDYEPDFDGDEVINQEIFLTPLADIQNAHIGVEAVYYLQRMIDNPPAHEPLLAALGGDPIALKRNIENELDLWKSNNLTPVFVFDGQSTVGKEEVALRIARSGLAKTQKAWELYAENQPEEAVKKFGKSGAVRAQDLVHILQEVLVERGINFIIAPFSACAQLAYLESLDEQYIDGIMGSQELLLYNIDDAVIFPPTAANWENKQFSGVVKSELIRKLNVTPELFLDALLMIGTSFLPHFPPLLDDTINRGTTFTILDAINQLRTAEKSVANVCAACSDILGRTDPHWLDKYRKAKMGIKHCVTVQLDGTVNIRDYDSLTGDNVEYLGLQLPPELYHYFSKAMIGPRLMNSFGSLESLVFPTLDGVVSDEYRKLVTESLPPLKETAASLISSRIHRGFQFKDIAVKYWFDDSLQQKLIHRNVTAQTNQRADTWGVRDANIKPRETAVGVPAGKLSFGLLSLQDKEFTAKSVSKEKITNLNSRPELISNVLWRLLHLRGYVNDQHELTSWGKALAISLGALAPIVKKYNDVQHIEEAAFLAFELLRFDNLNSRHRHPELIGGPLRGSESDKENCILIGRTSCLLKLRHNAIGYTGPLSKNLLAFHSLIKAVRETDRDLVEAITASMFLNGQVSRERSDFGEIGRSLPFATDVDIGLGIAVKTYLDDFLRLDTSPEAREADKPNYVSKYLPHSVNFVEDLDVAFKFFDALYDGVKSLGKELSDADRKSWENAKQYLDHRR